MTRRTQAQWQALIEEQAASGMTATEFCKQRGINDKYFSMRKQKLAKSSSQAQESSFTSLKSRCIVGRAKMRCVEGEGAKDGPWRLQCEANVSIKWLVQNVSMKRV